MMHFIVDCPRLEEARMEDPEIRRKPINKILLFEKEEMDNARNHMKYIERLWIRRKLLLDRITLENDTN